MANLYLTPHHTIVGEDALALSKEQLAYFGKKALIVTDSMMVKLGTVKKLTDQLDAIGMGYCIYEQINGEPDDKMITSGAALYTQEHCDCLIGIGGGSPIDAMKAIGAVIGNGGDICDYYGKIIDKPLPPTCAIPTTAGTGSEATQFTIINNTKKGIKMLLKGPVLMADLAIIDPVFTLSAPPAITAATGIDALCHAVEAYTSRKAFSLTDTMALSAIKRIFGNLLNCYNNGRDTASRAQMAIAAYEAGVSFNNSSVTIIHGMSRPIGALFHVPHGLSNAMLIDKCLRFALKGCPERFCTLAKAVGVYQDGMSDLEGGAAFIDAIAHLCTQLNIQTPEEFGIAKADFFAQIDKMAEDALASGSPANTVRQPNKDEIVTLYKSLYC